jgi:hypothetical protein
MAQIQHGVLGEIKQAGRYGAIEEVVVRANSGKRLAVAKVFRYWSRQLVPHHNERPKPPAGTEMGRYGASEVVIRDIQRQQPAFFAKVGWEFPSKVVFPYWRISS